MQNEAQNIEHSSIPLWELGQVLLLCCCCCCQVASVVSDSVRPHRQQPTRLSHPWDSPGKNTGVGCHFLLQCMKVKSESEVAQSCLTLCNPMDCSLPGSSVHGIFQARILECISISFSRVSSSPRDWNQVSYIVGRCFTIWATREEIRGFPGGPVVKTPHFHGRGHMFDPWSLVRDPACCAVQSNESKEEESEGMSCSTVTQGWR